MVIALLMYIIWEVNYFLNVAFVIAFGRLFDKKRKLNETTTIYGMYIYKIRVLLSIFLHKYVYYTRIHICINNINIIITVVMFSLTKFYHENILHICRSCLFYVNNPDSCDLPIEKHWTLTLWLILLMILL